MDPENDGVESPSAGPAEETPNGASDALDALLMADDYFEEAIETPEGGPATDDAALEPDGDESDPAETGDTPTDAETDDAEPEELKDVLKGLSRSQKGKVLQHYQGLAATRLQEAQEIENKARADSDARESQLAEIRSKRGSFIGEVEGKREDGTPIPTYQEIGRLLTTRGGDDVLEDKYGLSRDEALELKDSWDERRAMLDGSLDDFRTEAWVEAGKQVATSVASSGLPIDAIWKDVKGIGDVVPSVVAHLTSRHQAEVASLKKDYEGRLRAATANGTASAARTAAKSLPTPETGGRSDAGSARIYTESELSDPAFFKAHEADIDRAYEEGRIRPG